MIRRGVNVFQAVITLSVIFVLTLVPQVGVGSAAVVVCAACEPRVVADAMLNLLLFLPLGATFSPLFQIGQVVLGAT